MSITSANSVFTLSISGLFSIPQQLQGFSADDVSETEQQPAAQVIMGVDGNMAAGNIYVPYKQTVHFQSDSPSILVFEAWRAVEIASKVKFPAIGVLTYPSIGRIYALTMGFLTSYPPTPQIKRSLQPRRYEITWKQIIATPTTFSLPQ